MTRDDRGVMAELVHICGHCATSQGMTERCDLDSSDLRVADRVLPLLADAERRGAEKGWDEGYGCGVHDQEIAAEEPLGYWVAPGRVNPYGAEQIAQGQS